SSCAGMTLACNPREPGGCAALVSGWYQQSTPTRAAEVALDRIPELLGEIERLEAVLWARPTIRGRSPRRLPTGTANAKADRHCGRGSHRRSRMRFRTWWALYGALGRSRDPCLALWPSFCRRDVSFSPVPRARQLHAVLTTICPALFDSGVPSMRVGSPGAPPPNTKPHVPRYNAGSGYGSLPFAVRRLF